MQVKIFLTAVNRNRGHFSDSLILSLRINHTTDHLVQLQTAICVTSQITNWGLIEDRKLTPPNAQWRTLKENSRENLQNFDREN